jgi:hypothetical protein
MFQNKKVLQVFFQLKHFLNDKEVNRCLLQVIFLEKNCLYNEYLQK